MKLWCLTQGNWLSSNSGIQRWYLPNYQLDSLCFTIGWKIPLQLDHRGTGISNSRSFQAMKFALHFLDETMDTAWPTSTTCKSLVIRSFWNWPWNKRQFVCQYFWIDSRSSTLIHLKKRHGSTKLTHPVSSKVCRAWAQRSAVPKDSTNCAMVTTEGCKCRATMLWCKRCTHTFHTKKVSVQSNQIM